MAEIRTSFDLARQQAKIIKQRLLIAQLNELNKVINAPQDNIIFVETIRAMKVVLDEAVKEQHIPFIDYTKAEIRKKTNNGRKKQLKKEKVKIDKNKLRR